MQGMKNVKIVKVKKQNEFTTSIISKTPFINQEIFLYYYCNFNKILFVCWFEL